MKAASEKKLAVLHAELEELRHQLEEANETIEMIRTGQVDALVFQNGDQHELYTVATADQAYRLFIENMIEGAVALNPDGFILYCNASFARMLGMALNKVMGADFLTLIVEEDQRAFKKILTRSLTQEVIFETHLLSERRLVPVKLSVKAQSGKDDTAINILLTDLTAQKHADQLLKEKNDQLLQTNSALETSNHDLQQFASVASHDLQEPLRKIILFCDLLAIKASPGVSPELLKYIEKITHSSRRMKTLVVDILRFSKLSAEEKHFDWVDVNELIAGFQDDFELLINEKKAQIIAEDLPGLFANKGQIRQAFQNIIANALKFSKEEEAPEIHITGYRVKEKSFDSASDPDGPFCLYSIRDNGIGFEEKYTGKIFELFQRLHSKNDYEGSGIGLAIAKKIVEKHDGRIMAKSIPDRGAEFLLLLPHQ